MIEKKILELKALDKTIEGYQEKRESLIKSIISDEIKLKNITSKWYYEVILDSGVITGNCNLKALCKVFNLNYDSSKSARNLDKERIYFRKLGGTIRKILVENYKEL